jgi:hypothetical protein
MKIDIKAMALTWAILWGGIVLMMGVANLIWVGYGHAFLELLSSWYPGYDASRSIGAVVIMTLYAIVDGFIGGAILSWLYNRLAKAA